MHNAMHESLMLLRGGGGYNQNTKYLQSTSTSLVWFDDTESMIVAEGDNYLISIKIIHSDFKKMKTCKNSGFLILCSRKSDN